MYGSPMLASRISVACGRFTKTSFIKATAGKAKNLVIKDLHDFSRRNKQDEQIDFLYGLSVVIPALEQRRRKLYRLFYHEVIDFRKKSGNSLDKIISLANEAKVPVVKATKWELNELVENRPHQGVVLKASRITPLNITCLGKPTDESYQLIQSNESIINISISSSEKWPLWLALDQVVDPQVG
ncbi:15927_t:CDS:2 [Acaulospora morrowiae]|uniref:15927_t:CDS:1 n=1 Tax=Acaulospora morrowiae TaxID=94023 RepID=A0A9N9B6S6_9GLOM|nr:15927_t:CDS:2 [Acaulospora morrowiae]